ncbi:MAG: metal-dependent hydrolase [Hyphomicrobiaceae bacterium]|nr:metal-dependent hydrolase [Hyphomicrobiaceae bacterium]
MANFTTHIAVGTVVSGALATLTLAADVIAPENLVAVAFAGTLGSILPDVDLKDSRPSQAMFSGLAVFMAFAILFTIGYKYSIAEMWIMWIGTYLGIRYGAHFVFHRMSYHRGIYHSVLAGLFFACVTAVVFHHMLGRHPGVSWLAGGFMFIGYLVHLTLDEMYSVDVMGARIKTSFGSALKLFDHKHLGHSSAMAIATVLVFLLTPPMKPMLDGLTSRSLWKDLQARLLPRDKWFGVIASARRPSAGTVGAGSPITTGALPKPEQTKPASPAAR